MNILVRESSFVGGGKSICGYCYYRGYCNFVLKSCFLKKCIEYTYCGIKEKYFEYFS